MHDRIDQPAQRRPQQVAFDAERAAHALPLLRALIGELHGEDAWLRRGRDCLEADAAVLDVRVEVLRDNEDEGAPVRRAVERVVHVDVLPFAVVDVEALDAAGGDVDVDVDDRLSVRVPDDRAAAHPFERLVDARDRRVLVARPIGEAGDADRLQLVAVEVLVVLDDTDRSAAVRSHVRSVDRGLAGDVALFPHDADRLAGLAGDRRRRNQHERREQGRHETHHR